MAALLKNPFVIAMLTIIAVFYYLSLDKTAKKALTSSETVNEVEQEVETLSSQVAVIEKKLEDAQQPLADEKVIRDELLLQKSGEYILQLPAVVAEETMPPLETQKTPWQEWQEILF